MRLSVILGMLSALNIGVGFLYQWYGITVLGASRELDALYAGMTVPQLLLTMIGGSLTNVLVPHLAVQHGERLKREAWTFVHVIGVLFSGLVACLYFSAPMWVPWTIPGFDAYYKALTVQLLRIQLFGLAFSALVTVTAAVYQARNKFLWVEISQLGASLVVFFILVHYMSAMGVKAVAWAMAMKPALQLALLLPGMGAYKLPAKVLSTLAEPWNRFRPLFLGSAYYKTELFVDRFLSSMAPPGEMTLFNLGSQVYTAAAQVVNKGLCMPVVPLLARLSRDNDRKIYYDVVFARLLWIAGIVLAGLILLVLLGKNFLSLTFGHSRLDKETIRELWLLMISLYGVFAGGVMGQILSTSFYAVGDTVTPARIGAIGYTLGLFFKIAGFTMFGVFGIALGTSAYYMLNAVWMFIKLKREHKVVT